MTRQTREHEGLNSFSVLCFSVASMIRLRWKYGEGPQKYPAHAGDDQVGALGFCAAFCADGCRFSRRRVALGTGAVLDCGLYGVRPIGGDGIQPARGFEAGCREPAYGYARAAGWNAERWIRERLRRGLLGAFSGGRCHAESADA